MTNKCEDAESPAINFKDESARLRWELFHRAIAHAKKSNSDALADTDAAAADNEPSGPTLSIVR
jgi:hypothetical protein